MTTAEKMRRFRAAYTELMLAAEAVRIDLEREQGTFVCTLPDLAKVQETVATHYRIPLAAMYGPRRTEQLAFARHVAMHLSRELTRHSLEVIGQQFGGRDHGTVMHAMKRVATELEVNPRFRRELAQLRETVRTTLGLKHEEAA